jgi:uncharacterized membrane protein YebE (DUF533 family)
MNLTNLNDAQQQAFLDLVVLAMYADGHLASAENARVQQLLEAMGTASDYDRNWLFDAAVARVRKHADTPASLRSHAASLAQSFATPEQRKQANEILTDLFGSEQLMSPRERDFLAVVRQALEN